MTERRSVLSRLLTRAACLLAAAVLAAPLCAPRPNCAYADEPEGLAKPAWEAQDVNESYEKGLREIKQPWLSRDGMSVEYVPLRPIDPEEEKAREPETPAALPAINLESFFENFYWVCVVLFAILALAVLAYASRLVYIRARDARDLEEEPETRARRLETLAPEARDRYDDLLAAATDAYARGDYRAAIIFYFSWLLVEMDKRGFVLLDKGKTNLEYWSELEGTGALRDIYRAVMRRFESVYFGGMAISQEVFDRVWTLRDSFAGIMAERDAQIQLERERAQAPQSSAARLLLIGALLSSSVLAGCSSNDYWRIEYSSDATHISNRGMNGVSAFRRYCGDHEKWNISTSMGPLTGIDVEDGYNAVFWFKGDYGSIANVDSTRVNAFGWGVSVSDGLSVPSAPPFFSMPSCAFDLDESEEENWPDGFVFDFDDEDGSEEFDGVFESDADGSSEKKTDAEYEKEYEQAWRNCVRRYAEASEDDWDKFAVDLGDRQNSTPYTGIRRWLEAKPNRTFVLVSATRWDALPHYLLETRDALKRGGSKNEKAVEECEKRITRYCSIVNGVGATFSSHFKTRHDAAVKALQDPDAFLRVKKASQKYAEENDKRDFGFTPPLYVHGEQSLKEEDVFTAQDFDFYGYDSCEDWAGVCDLNGKNPPAREPPFVSRYIRSAFEVKTPADFEKLRRTERFSGDPEWTRALPETGLLTEVTRLETRGDTRVLVALGDVPLVCERKIGESRLLIVNSTSFLSNYGALDPANRALAAQLARQIPRKSRVAFVYGSYYLVWNHSGEIEEPSPFSLSKLTPFTLFVWHAFALVLIAVFCAFPILGRPRRLPRERVDDFSKHIDAIAREFKRAGRRKWPQEQLREFENLYRGDSGAAEDEPAAEDGSAGEVNPSAQTGKAE